MRAHEIKQYDSVLQTLGQPGCPICAFLKNVQAKLLQEEPPVEILNVCNVHAWGLAAVRQAEGAAKIFLSLMESRCDDESRKCSICLRLEQEEIFRTEELIAKLSSRSVTTWVSKHGVLCIPHASRMRAQAPASIRPVIDAILDRTNREMQILLSRFIAESTHGNAGHSGILGRAAEYLVAQRGLSLVRDRQGI